MSLRITSNQNPKVIAFSKLKDEKYRAMDGLFLCEGEKLTREALCASKARYILCSEDRESLYEELICEAEHKGAEIIILSEAPFSKISTERSPQGIIAVCDTLDTPDGIENAGKSIMCCGVRDPGNLGTVIRTAAGLGFDGVIMCNCADVSSPRCVRASMGAIFRIGLFKCSDPRFVIRSLKEAGRKTYAAALEKDSLILGGFSVSPSDVFVIGNEGHGLAKELISECDATVYIPLRGGVESFNAAIAAGIILWEQSKSF